MSRRSRNLSHAHTHILHLFPSFVCSCLATFLLMAVQLYIDGPLLSSVFYDNACGDNDQEGFLIGQFKHEIEDSVNDAQINNRTEKLTMVIQGICIADSPCSFYADSGMLIQDKLQTLVGHRCGKVIGWFRSRKNSSLEPTYLERVIHHNLLSLAEENDSFLFLIFTTQYNKFVSTHTFTHVCLRSVDRLTFESVPMLITNLGNSAQGDYKRSTIASATNKVLENIAKPKTEPLIQGIRHSIEKKLQSLCAEVSDSETTCNQLEQEVARLRAEYLNRYGSSDTSDSVNLVSSNTNKRNSRLEYGLVKESSSVSSNSSLNAFGNSFTSKGNSDRQSKGSPTY